MQGLDTSPRSLTDIATNSHRRQKTICLWFLFNLSVLSDISSWGDSTSTQPCPFTVILHTICYIIHHPTSVTS